MTVKLSDDARAALRPGEVLVLDWRAAAGRCAPPLGQVAVHRVDRCTLVATTRFEPLGADGPVAVLAHRRLLGHLAGRAVRIDCRRRRWRRPRFTADLPAAFSLCEPRRTAAAGRAMISPPVPGDPAPPLDLPVLGGGRFDLVRLRGQAVLVSFLRHAG